MKPQPIHKRFLDLSLLLVLALSFAACSSPAPAGTATGSTKAPPPKEVRVAYFANLTHIQPLVGMQRGTFQQELGTVVVKPTVFNAGPAEIEAIFAGSIDIGYIGPSPAVNGYIKSNRAALRVVAGAMSGGASLVVRPDAGITTPESLKGKRLASPQLGNTQDVALRYYLKDHGLKTVDEGGDVRVINISNSDILTLFQRKEVDGAWVPEPWVARLVNEAGGKLFLDERDLWPNGRFATTVVVVRKDFLDKYPDVVSQWLKAHVEVSQWIKDHPEEAKAVVSEELKKLTGATLPPEVLMQSLGRMSVETDPMVDSIKIGAEHSHALGFLGTQKLDLGDLYDSRPLEAVTNGKP